MYLKDRRYIRLSAIAILLLILSLFVNYYAGTYATERESNPVTDIVLSNIPTYDVDAIFVYGAIIMVIVIALYIATHHHTFPFVLKSIAIFVLIRSVFISLTHIGAFPSHVPIDSINLLSRFSFGGDLFFSGHTGLPFLLALITWKQDWWRNAFLVFSGVFSVVVLLGHLHYTIDVLSAFFITYTIFHISIYIFSEDYSYFEGKVEAISTRI